jgi:TPR repeat protein
LGAISEATDNRSEAFHSNQKAAGDGDGDVKGIFTVPRCLEQEIGCSPNPGTAAHLYQELIDQANHASAVVKSEQLKMSGNV